MSFTPLNPSLPVSIEGKGTGLAFAVIDYGVRTSPNPKVRMRTNWTMGRSVARIFRMQPNNIKGRFL